MTRLQRSVEGFIRRVEMSRRSVFLVVEGRHVDANYYGSILEAMPELAAGDYEICVIDQISGLRCRAGKSAVLELHDRFRRRGALRQENRAGARSTLFCVDRDLDHATGRLRRSSHIIYTCHYNVEAEVFFHGRHEVACARALSLSPAEGSLFAARIGDWPRRLADLWREWLELCVLEAGLHTSTGASPARKSAVNHNEYGPLAPSQFSAARARIHAASNGQDTSQRGRRLLARFRNIAASEGPESFLNGKHLPVFFEFITASEAGTQPVAANGSSRHVLHCYLGSVDFTAPWADHFKHRVREHIRPVAMTS